MKTFKILAFCAVITACIIVALINVAMAEDVILNAKVTDVTTALDRHGVEYTRIIITEARELNGVKYTTGVPVIAFGDLSAKAKTLKPGQMLKAIASGSEYKGRWSYTAIAFVE